VGGILWGFGALALRLCFQFLSSKLKGQRFDALDQPTGPDAVDGVEGEHRVVIHTTPGKFF
jgi:hypothetical protein